MKNIKRWIYLAAIFALASCKYTASEVAPTVDTPEFAKPVILPLKLSAAKKIDWEKIKQMPLHPVVEKFDLHSLPSQTYDIVQVTPFLQPVQKFKFDYDALPESGLDIDKLPARRLKFKVSVLPKPKMKKAGPPRLKDSSMPVFEIGSMAQVFFGKIVSCVYKDRDGLLWIGTDRGLFRYDGENLFLYLTTTPPNPFNSIIQDELGQIWAGQYNVGISVLDIKNGLLKKVDETGGLTNTKIERLKEDDEHRIWIAYFPGAVNIIDQKEQIVKQLGRAEGLSDTTGIVGFTFDKHQRVGIGTYRGGFNIIDLHNKKIKYFNKAHGLSSDTVSAIFHDRSDRIWLTRNGRTVSVLDMKENVVQNIKTQHFGNMDASEMFEDLEGRVWISTFGNGLEIVDLAKNIYSQLTTANGLSSDIVINITGNSKDQLFLSTSQGLNCIENNSLVTQYVNRINTTAQVEDKQGLIWQATVYNGVNIIDRKAGVVRHLGAKDGLTNDTLQTIRQLDGKFFILSNRGFDIIDAEKQTITHLKRDQFTNSRPNSVVLDKTGRIWIGRNIGLDVYDLTGKWVKHIDNPEFNKAVIADLSRDSLGKIWVSPNSKGSISIIDPNKWNFRTIKNIDVINEKGIKALTTDKTGRMWIGTASGIYIANLADSTFVNITSRHGLIDNNVNSTLLYGDRAFVNTNSGLSVIKLPSTGVVSGVKLRIESFGPNYGFEKSLQNYYETDLITRDGLYWWGDAGISVLDFSKKDTSVDPVFITGVNIMDQPKYFSNRSDSQRSGKNKFRSPGDNKHDLVKNVSKSKEQVVGMTWAGTSGPYDMPMDLELPYNQNFISFQYNNLNFIKRDTVWFSYILIGADKNWSDITSSPFTRNYINLQPGKYTFKVISKSRNGLWSKPAQLTFTINPPWWLTWWAYVIYICLFIALTWSIAYYRSLQLIKDKRILEHKVQVRTGEVMQQKEEIEAQRDSLEAQRNDLEKAIQELKTAQTQLIQSEKMASLGELTAGIAHEIQNPLNFVNNFSEVSIELLDEMEAGLKRGETDEVIDVAADIKRNLEKIQHHGKRADFIVKGMLQHSRASTGEKQLTNMNSLADEFFRLSYHGLRAKDKSFNAELTTHFDDNLPKVSVVPQDMGRVMLNLFNNAFYAVNQRKKIAGDVYKPEVSVTTFAENNHVTIKVKDNGNGIPKNIKDKIMQPFFTTKPTGEGTGLGLSLTYDMVVKGHGGSIDVNTEQGKYTEFIIKLPVI